VTLVPHIPALANDERLLTAGCVPRRVTYIVERTNGPYISQVTGERFSDVNRHPEGDHRLSVARAIGDAEPESPPRAI